MNVYKLTIGGYWCIDCIPIVQFLDEDLIDVDEASAVSKSPRSNQKTFHHINHIHSLLQTKHEDNIHNLPRTL